MVFLYSIEFLLLKCSISLGSFHIAISGAKHLSLYKPLLNASSSALHHHKTPSTGSNLEARIHEPWEVEVMVLARTDASRHL